MALAMLSRLNNRWPEVGAPIRAFFTQKSDNSNRLECPFLLEIRDKINQKRDSARRAGKASSRARKQGNEPLDFRSNETSTTRCHSVATKTQPLKLKLKLKRYTP